MLEAWIGYTFTKLPNGVVVRDGIDSHIHRSVFASTWISDTHRISTDELMEPGDNLVAADHDEAHPPPRRMETGKRSISPAVSPTRAAVSVSDYQPTSPNPSQLELPEAERTPSWSQAENSQPPKRQRPGTAPSTSDARYVLGTAPPPSETRQVTMPQPPVIRPPLPAPQPEPALTFARSGFLTVTRPCLPQLPPNPPDRALQDQIDLAVSREVYRKASPSRANPNPHSQPDASVRPIAGINRPADYYLSGLLVVESCNGCYPSNHTARMSPPSAHPR